MQTKQALKKIQCLDSEANDFVYNKNKGPRKGSFIIENID